MNIMDWLTPTIAGQIISTLLSVGAIYGAIRADIKAIHARLDALDKRDDYQQGRIDALHLRGPK